ncbi:MAG: RNA polymerase sigma factor RpoD, partial [Chloroflexi bacterium]|nr:RNA polymerase sigma factor RpoD [Chloroflexota bacterium]
MTLENYEESERFPAEQESDEELPTASELGEEIKPGEELTLETALEPALEADAPEVADEPVRLYLHEIGRVSLLTAADERTLAKKIESAKRIKEIKQDYLEKHEESPSPTAIVLAMLNEVGQAANTISLLQEQLGLKPTSNFKKAIADPKLRDSINGVISQQLVQTMAHSLNELIPETEQLLIDLSLNYNLLPEQVLDNIKASVSLADIASLVTNEAFIKSVQAHEKQI